MLYKFELGYIEKREKLNKRGIHYMDSKNSSQIHIALENSLHFTHLR